LIIDSALRIRAFGQRVEIEALTENGQALLPLINAQLAEKAISRDLTTNHLTVIFAQPESQLDEDSRLKSASCLDVLRALPALAQAHFPKPEILFMGGLFAYDLVANFEALPEVAATNQCPDFCFFVAEHYLV